MGGLVIQSVVAGSIADEMGVSAGDRLLAINGSRIRDLIDYSYRSAYGQELLLEVEKEGGEIWELEIERETGEPLGLVFHPPKPSRCGNNCIFCFVHQMPKGLRSPLYVKDEDYRLSFLNGNYVTLTNLKPSEMRRIEVQRLSPLYISVHATDPVLREKLIGRKGIPPILEQLKRLAAARIIMHTQVVLCPGVNDGDALERTVEELAALYPAVQSLAIVPVGLTSHRKGLPWLEPVDKAYAAKFLDLWLPTARRLAKRLGEPFLFLADEFFLKAGRPFPRIKEYGDFPQIENGVGMVPLFMRDAGQTLRRARRIGGFRVTVVTGMSAAGFVSDFAAALADRSGLDIVPASVQNRLFGDSVTVAGLVSGRDIVSALEGMDIGDALFIPDVMLKDGEGIFLDDMTLEELEKAIKRRVIAFDSTPSGFYSAMRDYARGGN